MAAVARRPACNTQRANQEAAQDRRARLDGVMLTLYSFRAMTHQGLGEFEQLVLLAIVHMRGESYGIPIVDEIERRTGRQVARAAVYVTLRRLEEKGYVSSWIGDPTPERGGKGRRYVKIESAGRRALRESRQLADRMWGELDPASLRSR
jgi:PadR family transcriptional regulator PadR